MPGQKSPVLLRIMIVGVALFLGFSLNMFQFRNPFRGAATDYDQGKQALNQPRPEPVQRPIPPETESIRQESPVPLPKEQAALEPAPESASPSGQSGAGQMDTAKPEQGAQAEPAKPAASPAHPESAAPAKAEGETPAAQTSPLATPAAIPPAIPAAPPAPGNVAVAPDAAKPEPPAAGNVAVVPEQPGLSVPKVTTSREAARAAKLGRTTPAGRDRTADKPDALAAQAQAQTPGTEAGAAKDAGPEKKPASAAGADQGKKATVTTGGEEKSASPKPGGNASASGDTGKSVTVTADSSAKAASSAKPEADAGAPDASSAKAQEMSAAQAGGKVSDIKTEEKPGEFVLTISTDGPIGRVTTFHAKNPARLVVDLWGGWQTSGPMNRPVPGDLMERIRLGQHPDKTRLVIDYNNKDLQNFSEPVVEKQPKGVVIRLSKAGSGQ